MENKNKLQVGQKVWVETYSERYGQKSTLSESEISKIGKKFFEVTHSGYSHGRYYIETLEHDGGDYSSKGRIWLSEQDYKDQIEAEKLNYEFRKLFQYSGSGLSLDQLRRIKSIVDETHAN